MRGHKAGLLTVADYNNLTQCEALDDIKLNLVGGRPEPCGGAQGLPRAPAPRSGAAAAPPSAAVPHLRPRRRLTHTPRRAARAAGGPPLPRRGAAAPLQP